MSRGFERYRRKWLTRVGAVPAGEGAPRNSIPVSLAWLPV
jgi:hypothetical protein